MNNGEVTSVDGALVPNNVLGKLKAIRFYTMHIIRDNIVSFAFMLGSFYMLVKVSYCGVFPCLHTLILS